MLWIGNIHIDPALHSSYSNLKGLWNYIEEVYKDKVGMFNDVISSWPTTVKTKYGIFVINVF